MISSLKIRHATKEDIPHIRDIAHRTWPSTFETILSADQISYMLDLMYSETALHQLFILDDHHFIIAEIDQQAVAYAGYQHHYLPSTTKLHKLYVLPSYQGHQLGVRLCQQVAAFAKTAGDSKVRLDVNKYNRATEFYERIGYTRVGEAVTPIGKGYVMDDFVYEKNII